MDYMQSNSAPEPETEPEKTTFWERHKAAQRDLTPEDEMKLKRGNRTIMVATVILGILMLALGVMAGKAISDSRNEAAPQLTAAFELIEDKEVTNDVR